MKKIILLKTALVLCIFAQAQIASFEKNSEFKPDYEFLDYVGNINKDRYFKCYLPRKGELQSKIMLCKYDAGNRLLLSEEYKSSKIDGTKNYVSNLLVIAGKVYLFSYTAEHSICTLFAQEIDPSTLQLIGSPKKITDRKYTIYNDPNKTAESFIIEFNSDSSMVVISHKYIRFNNVNLKIFYHVLSLDLGTTIWKRDVDFDLKLDRALLLNTILMPNGDVYGAISYKENNKIFDLDRAVYLYSITGSGADFTVSPLTFIPHKAITNLRFFQKGNDIYALGLYSEIDWRFAKGYFIAAVSKSGLSIKMSQDFSADIATKFNGNSVFKNESQKKASFLNLPTFIPPFT